MIHLVSLILLPVALIGAGFPQGGRKPAFTFLKADYFHRYTKDSLHEFTPRGQSVLKKWTDMVTINDYSKIKDGEELATAANKVLEAYKEQGGVVLRTNSVPRTEKKPAEHLVVVLFSRREFMEVAFARFLLIKGAGTSIVFSHRIYGKDKQAPISNWIEKNGEKVESALMSMPVPKH